MNLHTELTVGATVSQAFERLADAALVAACLPGLELTARRGDVLTGTLGLVCGSRSASYEGTFATTSVDREQRRTVLTAVGKESNGPGGAVMTITARAAEVGETGSDPYPKRYESTTQRGGKGRRARSSGLVRSRAERGGTAPACTVLLDIHVDTGADGSPADPLTRERALSHFFDQFRENLLAALLGTTPVDGLGPVPLAPPAANRQDQDDPDRTTAAQAPAKPLTVARARVLLSLVSLGTGIAIGVLVGRRRH